MDIPTNTAKIIVFVETIDNSKTSLSNSYHLILLIRQVDVDISREEVELMIRARLGLGSKYL